MTACRKLYELHREKTCLRVSGLTQIRLYSHMGSKARGLKFWIWGVEWLMDLCSENKGADQLCEYRTADLSLNVFTNAKSRFSRDAAHYNEKQSE